MLAQIGASMKTVERERERQEGNIVKQTHMRLKSELYIRRQQQEQEAASAAAAAAEKGGERKSKSRWKGLMQRQRVVSSLMRKPDSPHPP